MDQRPYPIEPMRSGTIVGRSFSTYYRNLSRYAIFVFVISGLFSLISFILGEIYPVQGIDISTEELFDLVRTSNTSELSRLVSNWRTTTATSSRIFIITFTASLFLSPLISGGVAYITTGYLLGEKRTPGEWFRLACSKYKSLFVTHICTILLLTGVAFLLGIALVVAFLIFGLVTAYLSSFVGILLMLAAVVVFVIVLMFLVAAQSLTFATVVREDISGFRPIFRAIELCYFRFWRTIGLALLSTLVLSLCTLISSYLIGLVLDIFGAGNTVLGRLFDNMLIPLIFNPLTPIAFNILYVSLRIEKEGYLLAMPDGYNYETTENSDIGENH
ncbi:MAG: hypothetical protein GX257_04370 [Clostridiales bacterium]|nr:hypothetical protein [Clostridiales bacterium]